MITPFHRLALMKEACRDMPRGARTTIADIDDAASAKCRAKAFFVDLDLFEEVEDELLDEYPLNKWCAPPVNPQVVDSTWEFLKGNLRDTVKEAQLRTDVDKQCAVYFFYQALNREMGGTADKSIDDIELDALKCAASAYAAADELESQGATGLLKGLNPFLFFPALFHFATTYLPQYLTWRSRTLQTLTTPKAAAVPQATAKPVGTKLEAETPAALRPSALRQGQPNFAAAAAASMERKAP